MNIFKGLHAASLVSLLAVGSALAVACNDDPTPGTADAGPDATPAADGGGTDSGDAGDPCAFGEPNDTRETATAIDLNKKYTGLCVSNPDPSSTTETVEDELDFFQITAPATDLAGGYVQLTISNVSTTGLADFIITSAADNVSVGETYTTTEGGSVTAWFTVAPGAKYNIQVDRFGGHGLRFSYDLEAKYTATPDAFEPNDTKVTAKPITVGTPIMASAAAHDANALLTDDDQADYYSVSLTGGSATISLTNAPATYLCDVELFDPAGVKAEQGEAYVTDPGADCIVNAINLTGGTYTVYVHPFGSISNYGEGMPPAYVTGQYKLAVTQ